MAAAFREVWSYRGVDEDGKGGTAMIVPLGGSNFVQLVGGAGLKPVPNNKAITVSERDPNVLLTKLTEESKSKVAATASLAAGKMLGIAQVVSNKAKLFEISGNARIGLGGRVEVTDPTTKSNVALKVVILEAKPVKIAIRQVRAGGTAEKPVFHSKLPYDPKALVAEINALWTPQANVVFELVPSEAAEIDEAEVAKLLGLQASTAPLPRNVDMAKLWPLFAKLHVAKAQMTMFLVERASDDTDKVLGAAKPQAKVALVGDDRSERTMAHEAGHILGSGSGPTGWYDYGHQGKNPKLLMREGGAAWKIPFDDVIGHFNGKY
jgi:hypothetical protein